MTSATGMKWWTVGMFVALAACGGKDKAAGTGIAIDPAAVNALVPAPLKAALEFEKRDVVIERGRHKTTYTLAAPKGWEHTSKMFATLDPPKDAGVGFFTKLQLGSNCDGECKPKDWEAIAGKVNFEPLASGTVLKDVKGPGNRLMVAETGSDMSARTHVVFAWWTKGADNYHTCHAELGNELKDATAAFEKACQAILIVGDD